MRFAMVAVLAVILGLPHLFAAPADPKSETKKHIDQAMAAVDAEHHLKAADHLQQAIASLHDLAKQELERFLPAMKSGWKVEEPSETVGDLYYVIQVVRSYRRQLDESPVIVSILSSRRLAALHKEMYDLVEFQELTDNETSAETIDADGWEGYRQRPKDGPAMTVAYHSPLVVIAQGEDPDLVAAVWKKIDFKSLQKFTAE